jgi:hypothetical protein
VKSEAAVKKKRPTQDEHRDLRGVRGGGRKGAHEAGPPPRG